MRELAERPAADPMAETGEPGRARFLETVQTGLDFWREKTTDLDDYSIGLLDAERSNLYRAVQFGLAIPEAWELTAQISLQAIPLVNRRMYWAEWIPVLQELIRRAPSGGEGQTFQLYIQLGRCQRMLRRLEEATESHQAATAVASEYCADLELAEAYYNVGRDYFKRRMYDLADQNSYAALALLNREILAHQGLIAKCHDTLGSGAIHRGELVEAETHLRTAVELYRQIGDNTFIARMLSSLALAVQNAGRYDEAIGFYREADDLLSSSANELDKTLVRLNLGSAYYSQGNLKAAEASLRRADSEFLRRSGNIDYRARVLSSLGNVMLKQERWSEAEAYLEMSIELWEELGDELSLANAVGALGEVLAGRGDVDEGLALIEEALAMLNNYPDHAWAKKLRNIFETERDRFKQKM